MNWYKKSQNIQEQYQALLDQANSIQLTGTGLSESLTIPNSSQSITARELLNRVKMNLLPVLTENHVHTIDTSPIPNIGAQGLAISHEPGIIHVDVSKLFNVAKQSLPPTSQLDAVQNDPDIINSLVQEISNWIEGELLETISHEARHVLDYVGAYESGQPFTTVEEYPAEQFGQQMRQRYFGQ